MGGVEGYDGVPARGLRSQREKGILGRGPGLAILQGSEICRASPQGGPAPPHPRVTPAPQLRRRRQHNLLLLCSRSRSRSAETADGEVSSALPHARPDPHPASSQDLESPHPRRVPSPAVSRLGQDGGAPALVCLGLCEVRSQGSSRARGLASPTPGDTSGLVGWAEASEDKTPPTSLQKTHSRASLPQFPSRGKDALNLDRGTGGRLRNSVRWGRGKLA